MAIFTLNQSTATYTGSTGAGDALNDVYYVPITKTASSSFLSGTYKIDTNGSGNDTLVFQATNLFTSGSSLFLPQFELVGTTPTWIAYDQRATPFRVEWASMNAGDKVQFEIWNTTPASPTTPVLLARQESQVNFITTAGAVSTANAPTQALHAVQTTSYFTPYMDSLFWDNDVKWAGTFYVGGDGYLGTTEAASRTAAQTGDTAYNLGSGFSNYIYSQVLSLQNSFNSSSQYKAVQTEIHIDSGALLAGTQRYLELIGSIGNNALTTNYFDQYASNYYNNKVPDVEYQIYIDSASAGGLTIHETDTGVRNWWDSVTYSDWGITASGGSGQVNSGSLNNYGATTTPGVTVNTGLFTATGGQTAKASIASIEANSAGGGSWITLAGTNSLAVNDKVYLYGLSSSAVNTGPIQNSNVYVVSSIDASSNRIKLAYPDSTNTPINFYNTVSGVSTATIQKISDYDLTVSRGNATDVFAGIEQVELTTGNDTINYGQTYGSGGLGIRAGKGSDTWNLAAQDDWGYLEIKTYNGPSSITGLTNGIAVNISGSNQSFKTGTGTFQSLTSNTQTWNVDGSRVYSGQMLDEYGYVDNFNISSGGKYTDSQTLDFRGTTYSDRYYFAADGLGTIGEYRVNGNAGYDQIFITTDATGATYKNIGYTSTNLSPVRTGGYAGVSVEGYSRFNHTANYVLSFETVSNAQGASKLAKLTQTANVYSSSTDVLNIANASDWSVGDVVTFHTSGTASGATLVNGTSYRIREVTTSGVKLASLADGSNITTITTANLSNATIDRLVDTGFVDKGVITFGDAAGDFTRLAFQYDALLQDTTTVAFRVGESDVLPTVGLGKDYNSTELAQNEKLASLVVSYRDVYDNLDPLNATKVGIQYINGVVDKGALGFDRLVEFQNSDVVGQRHFAMTDYNDIMIQTLGSNSLDLKLTAGKGEDKIFVEGRSNDANQRIEISLAQNEWGNGADGNRDIVEIGLGSLNKSYKSVQYIDVTNADSFDVIKFVESSGYTVVQQSHAATAGSYKNYVTYDVYQGASTSASNLVMEVRVGTGDVWSFQDWSNTSVDNYSWVNSSTSWGLISTNARTISASPTPAAMTAGNDATLLFEDTTTKPYLMGAGDDYVVTMGGDQDIALGAGDDYIAVKNTGQQLFVSGGAGNDTMGLSGFYTTLSDGTYVSDQWSFSSIDVNKAKAAMAAKYPDLSTTTDQFEWSTTALDRVMVATNRLDGTTIFFQAEQLGFSNGTLNAENFLPAINETYDLTTGNTTAITLYGRTTNDTINLKVDDVDTTLKYIGSWLDSKTTSLITTGTTLLGAHTLSINAQTASTDKWFSKTFTNGGISLVDIENIRLFDSAGHDVTVRVAGSSSYDTVADAVNAANRGDVIFVAETVQGALSGATRAVVNMDTTVSVASGLRVAFEEGANRTVNTTAQLTVNMTDEVKSSSVVDFLGHSSSALELLGTANINVNGSSGSDIIIGNKGNNVINGLAGNDLIFGGNGSDMLIGGIGDDTLIGGSGHKASAVANFAGESWSLFNLSTDAITTNDPQALEFKTGDKVVYTATGGAGVSAYIGGVATTLSSSTALYVIRTDNTDGTANFKLASSQTNALNGVFLDVISNGTATSHAFTLDNIAYSATNLPGNDYLYGGSGNDHLIATGVMGSLTTAGVRDTLTMNGGSGADTFTVLSNTGQINVFGGSGSDKFEVMDVFMDAVGMNKGERIVDFSATQDDVQSYFTASSLGSASIETRLNAGGVTLSQLVAPPLPIVDGSGENGNYQAVADQVNSTYALPEFGLSVADLLNIHNAHAA